MSTVMIRRGIYPTMITPFTPEHRLDLPAVERILQFYLENGVQGVFAVCQSSEMFHLSLAERVVLATTVVEANQRLARALHVKPLSVVASGHISASEKDQLEEARRIYDTGVDAFVLVSNRLDPEQEGDYAFRRRTEAFLAATGDMPLGIYECPYPYKRLLSPELLRWCAQTGRFLFLKDTCCDIKQIEAKIRALSGTEMGLFNANAQTLLPSLQLGAAGFSGVMANFHPDLYAALYRFFQKNDGRAQGLQDMLTFMAVAEKSAYPVTAKYHMNLIGIPMALTTRTRPTADLDTMARLETRALVTLEANIRQMYNTKE